MKRNKLQFCLFLLLALPTLLHGQFTFITNSGALTITGYAGPGGVVNIPATANGYPITTIWGDVFPATVTSVAIPENVTNISSYTFSLCSNLTNITVDTSNPAYSSLNGVFFDKAQLTLLLFPYGLSGNYTVPNSVTSIGPLGFAGSRLTGITLPEGLTNIGDDAFGGTNLSSITIPDSVISIGNASFAYSGLTNVTIPDSVTSVGYEEFIYCASLKSATIGAGLTNMGPNMLFRCASLTNITVNASNSAFSSLNGVLFDKAQGILIQFPAELGGSYNIPDGVCFIEGDAFDSCTKLTSVSIPDSVTNIGEGAFEICTSLASVGIPNSVAVIGSSAFWDCTSLTNVVISNSVASIEDSAFNFCYRLMAVDFGQNITSIGIDAFSGDYNLASVNLPDSVTNLGEGAFSDCQRMTSLRLGNGITSIPATCFEQCGFPSLTVPNSVTNIGDEAFELDSLTNVNFGNGLTSIGNSAFARCPGLASVTFPRSLTSIGDEAFYNCAYLTSAYFSGNAPLNDGTAFTGDIPTNDPATAYYLPGTTGWSKTFGGVPTALWFLPNPLILNNSEFGVQTNGFSFAISWATNISVVVEACTNLANPVWLPIQTNVLIGGISDVSDTRWTNYPGRFYRLRSP